MASPITKSRPRALRLRRSDCSGPGLRRIRRGRGFSYVDEDGDAIADPDTLVRLRELAIPPAWTSVWICADPRGHLQATGVDAAGRKQYLYHDAWRRKRDNEKFRRMLAFGAALPALRRDVARELGGDELTRERVLACAVRLLDVGLFRVGGEEYADEGGGLGLATLGKQHVTLDGDLMRFDYPAKSGVRRVHTVADAACAAVVRELRSRRGGGETLLAYRAGRRWASIGSDDINEYLKARIGEEFSAKDFRTWNATVLAAVVLAASAEPPRTEGARRRAVDAAVRGVSESLGNTPAVARRAYVDPRVFDRYRSGWTIAGALPARAGSGDAIIGPRRRARIERAVIDLLTDERGSPGLERLAA